MDYSAAKELFLKISRLSKKARLVSLNIELEKMEKVKRVLVVRFNK